MNANGYVGVRTRNREGGKLWGLLPALLNVQALGILTVGQFQSSKNGGLKRRLMFQIADNSVIGQHAGGSRSSKALNITFWIFQGLLAAALLVAGTTTGRPANAVYFL